MVIFKDYTTSDVLFDKPFKLKNINLYPIRVKEYMLFEKHIKYFLFSKKHYELDNSANLFEFVIGANILNYKEISANKEQNKEELFQLVIHDLECVLSIISRENIYLDEDHFSKGEISFSNKLKTINYNRNNYELIRGIILKQNALREPKIFENKIEERMGIKYIMALQKKKGKNVIDGLGEMANLISCVTGKSYETLNNQNIMQLYSDYFRCISIENYKTSVLFSTVTDKVKPSDYTEDVISHLFEDPYERMWLDKSKIGFLN